MHWEFILFVLEFFGFADHFCSIIHAILKSTRLSISLNGRLEGYFSCSCGVRQGNPLSPFLFAIGEDVLARMISCQGIRRVINVEAKLGVLVPPNLLYADNILIFL